MKLKISFFNKTIFRKNFTHYWPLWALYLIYIILVLPVNLWQYIRLDYYDDAISRTTRQYMALNHVLESALNPIPVFVFSAAAVMAVFSYLYTAKNANMIHSLPVNRLELFVTNFLSGFLFLALPEVIGFAIVVFVGIACGVTSIQYLFLWLLYTIGMTFFAVAFSTLVAMLTGNILAMPVYCAIGNFLYIGCVYMISNTIGNICYGISFSQAWRPGKSCILSPLYYLGNNVGCKAVWNEAARQVTTVEIHGGGLIAIYAAAAVVLLFAAYRIYRRRHLETAGDIIAIPALKPVFRWGAAVCGGFLLSNALIGVFMQTDRNIQKYWYLFAGVLVIGTICFWAAEMLIQKSFRVFKKKRLLEWCVMAVVSVAILSVFKLDVFGIEKKVPQLSEVSTGYINMDYPIAFSGDEIAEMISIQEQVIAAKEEYLAEAEAENSYWVTFRYYLVNGEVFERSYPLPVTEEYVADQSTPSARIVSREGDAGNLKKIMFGDNYEDNEYFSGYLEFYGDGGAYSNYIFTKEEMPYIVEAAMKDIEEGNYAQYQLYAVYQDTAAEAYFNCISLSYYNMNGISSVYDDYYRYDYGNEDEFVMMGSTGSVFISFGENCTNLVRALEDLGITNEDRRLYTYQEYEELWGW